MSLRARCPRPLPLALALALLLTAGCSERPSPPAANAPTPAQPEPEPIQIQTAQPALAPPATAPSEPIPVKTAQPAPEPTQVKTREILGKTTTDVRDKDAELKHGARVAETRITAKDPITLPGNAYVTIVGRQGALNVQHALDLYQAEHGEFPKTVDEFRAKILKNATNPDGVSLPALPYYQEYSYDPAEHKLVVLEYPDRKAGLQKQNDAKVWPMSSARSACARSGT